MNQNCLRCGNDNWESGKLLGQSNIIVALKLDRAPSFSLWGNNIGVSCKMCTNCGYIELLGDVGRAREVLKD